MLETPPTPPTGSQPTPAPVETTPSDRISPLVIIVLLAFWALQSSFVTSITNGFRHHSLARRAVDDAGAGVPSAVEQGILTIDLKAKSYYIASSGQAAGPVAAVIAKSLGDSRRQALNSATDLLSSYPNQPSMARRVILLRAENGDRDPLRPIPAVKGHASMNPLGAYTLPSGLTPAQRLPYDTEKKLWQQLFGSQPIVPGEVGAIASEIDSLSSLRWWGKLALHQLYLRAGDNRQADTVLAAARREAQVSVVSSSIINFGLFFMLLVGVIGIIMLIVRMATGQRQTGSILDETPPLIRDEDRRLGAGDLAHLFVFYLILMFVVQVIAAYGLNALIQRTVLNLPFQEQMIVSIGATTFVTALCGALTLAAMFWLARRRGADLRKEIGLNAGVGSLGRTILFGLLGWGIALPFVAIVGLLARALFHNAPAPANPAIPMLMSAPAGIATVMLYVLAALIAPFFEETVFRGLFYNAARLRVGVPWGIAVTGLAFGLSHPVGIAEQFTLASLGASLAWMAQTKKSLLPGMVAHCVQNSLVFATLLFSLMTITPQ